MQYGIDESARARPKVMIWLGIFIRGLDCACSPLWPVWVAPRLRRPGGEPKVKVAPLRLCLYPQLDPASLGRRRCRAAINRVRSIRVTGNAMLLLFLDRRGVLHVLSSHAPWGTERLHRSPGSRPDINERRYCCALSGSQCRLDLWPGGSRRVVANTQRRPTWSHRLRLGQRVDGRDPEARRRSAMAEACLVPARHSPPP